MAINYAIWLYKEFKHESEAHWAQALYPPGAELFPSHEKANSYAKSMFGNFGWKFEVVALAGEHSLEFWTDRFRGHHETGHAFREYNKILSSW